jgi:hypothetical protein
MYCFSTAAMVTRAQLTVTWHVHCMYCYTHSKPSFNFIYRCAAILKKKIPFIGFQYNQTKLTLLRSFLKCSSCAIFDEDSFVKWRGQNKTSSQYIMKFNRETLKCKFSPITVEETVRFNVVTEVVVRITALKLYNDQRNAQVFNLFMYLLLPYMFRAFF